jgi:hypothetical protein
MVVIFVISVTGIPVGKIYVIENGTQNPYIHIFKHVNCSGSYLRSVWFDLMIIRIPSVLVPSNVESVTATIGGESKKMISKDSFNFSMIWVILLEPISSAGLE